MDLFYTNPPVVKLAVHLKNQQNVMYQDTSDLQQVLSNCVRTTLTAWCEINLHTKETRNIDFPKHYFGMQTRK